MEVLSYAEDPTVQAVLQWRSDSATLHQVRQVLNRLKIIPDEGCRMGDVPYTCARLHNNRLCIPCAHRNIKADLFGEEGT